MSRIKIVAIDPLADEFNPLAIGMAGEVVEELGNGELMVNMDNAMQFDDEPVHIYPGEYVYE